MQPLSLHLPSTACTRPCPPSAPSQPRRLPPICHGKRQRSAEAQCGTRSSSSSRRQPVLLAAADGRASYTEVEAEAPRETLQADSIIEPDGSVFAPQQEAAAPPQGDRRALLVAALKLPIYSVAVVPVLVSAAAVYIETGAFTPLRTLLLCLGCVCILAWVNLSNDVFDSTTGVDKSKPESVVNLAGGARKRFFFLASAFLVTGMVLLFRQVAHTGSLLVPRMLAAAIACGYFYQGPPFRWSYLGLGEPLCFLAFGPLATLAFYLAQAPAGQAVTPMAAWLSVLVGLTSTVILFCSHFHQVDGDRAHGKLSPVVRLGMPASRQALKFLVGLTYILTLGLSVSGVLPFTVLTSAIAVYGLAGEMVKLSEKYTESVPQLRELKILATRWHIGYSAMLILGLLIQKLMV